MRIAKPTRTNDGVPIGPIRPWLIVDIPRADGTVVRLCDFASAGAAGSHYVSWLPAEQIAPPPPVPDYPDESASSRLADCCSGLVARQPSTDQRLRVLIADNPDSASMLDMPCPHLAASSWCLKNWPSTYTECGLFLAALRGKPWGTTVTPAAARKFTIDPSLPPLAPMKC